MTDDNSKTGLSRRKMLGGIGMIGVASAGAGLGTTAYFSDRTSFRDNHLEAGQLELFVDFKYYEDQGIRGIQEGDGTVAGHKLVEVSEDYYDVEYKDPVSIDLDDLKPGDFGKYKLCFNIHDNPAYLWLCGHLTENNLGKLNRPKKKAIAELKDEYDEDWYKDLDTESEEMDGFLGDALDVLVYYCDEDEHGEDFDQQVTKEDVEDDLIAHGSLKEVLADLKNGFPLDGNGELDSGVENRNCYDGTEYTAADNGEKENPCVCFQWSLSTEVGNEIQNDSVKFDLDFFAEQCRHNDGVTNPCITSEVVDGFGKNVLEAEKLWFSKARNGGSNTFELIVGDTDQDSDTSGFDYSGSAFTGEFTLTYDAASGQAEMTLANGDEQTVEYPVTTSDGNAISIVTRGNQSDHLSRVTNIRLNSSAPSGPDSVENEGSGETSLNLTDIDTSVSWTLTGEIEFEGLDNDPSASDENPAVYVDVLDAP